MTNRKFKLQVNSVAPGTFSHQLYAYCSVNGRDPGKYQIRKRVNFYKFKAYVEDVMKVGDFNNWYAANFSSVTFLFALEGYINHVEKRSRYYIAFWEQLINPQNQLLNERQNIPAII